MIPCNKRQEVVKRAENKTIYRCLHKDSGFYNNEVNESICSSCPVRSIVHKRPCKSQVIPKDKHHVTQQELVNVTDSEVVQMIKDAGMTVEGLDSDLPPDYPPLSVQLWTYKEELLRWHKAGRPTRTQEEVLHIYETHCKPCNWFDKEKQRCKGCGCKVTVGGIAITNKLKMGTSHCPQDKF